MWFKQIQLYSFNEHVAFDPEAIETKLESLAFTPCLASLPASLGWVPPLDQEEATLVEAINGCMMICLQFEEKLLPATVVRQELNNKIKEIEANRDYKVRGKEKLALKEEITHTLLTRAFTKITKVHAYIDTKNQWLFVNTTNAKKLESFVSLFKRTLDINISAPEVKKPTSVMTHWLLHDSCPTSMGIEKSCVLQDLNQQNRVIRAKHQNLFASSMQELLKDGCSVQQLAVSWKDYLSFVIAEDFTLRGINFGDEIIANAKENYSETAQQQFAADMLMMSDLFAQVMQILLGEFGKQTVKGEELETAEG